MVMGFVVAIAAAQLIAPLPWSFTVTAIASGITFIVGKMEDSLKLQVVAIGLIAGWVKCLFL